MSDLDELLRQPVMQLAMDVAKQEAFKGLPNPIPGVSYLDMVAAHGAQAEGWVSGLRALVSLSRKTIPQKQPDQREMYVEAAREKMLNSGLYTDRDLKEMNL